MNTLRNFEHFIRRYFRDEGLSFELSELDDTARMLLPNGKVYALQLVALMDNTRDSMGAFLEKEIRKIDSLMGFSVPMIPDLEVPPLAASGNVK